MAQVEALCVALVVLHQIVEHAFWWACSGLRHRQYFGTLGSTSSDQARIPPFRFWILRNPALRRKSTASAERFPLRQCATISREESSSCTRRGSSPSGIKCPFNIADLIFVRLAHVENVQVVAAIQPRLQFSRRHFRNFQIRRRRFFAANAAEFVVVDQLVNGAILAAHRAIRILAQLQFAELHAQRVEQQQTADEAVARAENQLDRFHRLDRADDSRQHAKHAAFGARRHQSRRRRFGIQAAVARASGMPKTVACPSKRKIEP